jgi:hypothetical protein
MSSTHRSPVFPRSLVSCAFTGLALAWTGSAAAESSNPPEPQPRIRIESGALAPESVVLAPGARLRFENDSQSMARVELQLVHGDGVACASAGEAPVRGRKFVVPGGGTLECDAPASAVDYRVYRSDAGSVRESSGRIEIAH